MLIQESSKGVWALGFRNKKILASRYIISCLAVLDDFFPIINPVRQSTSPASSISAFSSRLFVLNSGQPHSLLFLKSIILVSFFSASFLNFEQAPNTHPSVNMRASTLLALAPLAAAVPFNMKRDSPAPVLIPRSGRAIAGKYIVRMRDGTFSTAVSSAIQAIKADADHTFHRGFNGFSASLEDDELENLRHDPNVSSRCRPRQLNVPLTCLQG